MGNHETRGVYFMCMRVCVWGGGGGEGGQTESSKSE